MKTPDWLEPSLRGEEEGTRKYAPKVHAQLLFWRGVAQENLRKLEDMEAKAAYWKEMAKLLDPGELGDSIPWCEENEPQRYADLHEANAKEYMARQFVTDTERPAPEIKGKQR